VTIITQSVTIVNIPQYKAFSPPGALRGKTGGIWEHHRKATIKMAIIFYNMESSFLTRRTSSGICYDIIWFCSEVAADFIRQGRDKGARQQRSA
jgi:hypothetical protein